ncbi:hypothetical protein CVT24_001363 [Panaeolus cyanescens]|uniref:DNA repair protein RAD50 n=1 Tax=Panaeolus cyanescens TaxID=181874 RepID=A0A409VTM9_9AGAR|nr:hypothetical protein CVT24_001363 [Panaeolus cyanescens]
MASLSKLAIRGIRSFDDKHISVIEFFSPVTVIVGHNGSGKTTIIECLKYATTGDQPPNTRGGAFIHDPKMANEKEVKAQVKLRFHAANGTRMLAVRNLSVSVKKNSLSMKTLESILSVDGNTNGKRATISTKCAEMDEEIPQLFGVSKAVLENVIFCHQEDSYWPLAEPAQLKKKFDEIFEATRYTKALDNIKALRKERAADLKADKERLILLSREKAHSDKLRERVADTEANIARKQSEYEETKAKHDALRQDNDKFYALHNKFREMYLTVAGLEENKTRVQTTLVELKAKYTEIPGSLEELEQRERQFKDEIDTQMRKRLAEVRKKEDMEDELTAVQNQQKDLLGRLGRLQAEAEEQERRIAAREREIKEIGDAHAIKGYTSPLKRQDILEFMSRIDDLERAKKSEVEHYQGELRSKTDEYQERLRTLDRELDSRRSSRQRLRDQISEYQMKVNKLDRELEGLQDLPAKQANIRTSITEKKEHVEKVKSNIAAANYEKKLNERTSKARQLEEQRDQLSLELQAISMQAQSRATLELKRTEAKTKTSEIETMLELSRGKLASLTKNEVDADTIEGELDNLSIEKEHQIADATAEAQTASKRLQKADLDITHLRGLLDKKKDELKGYEKKLQGAFDHRTLDEAIQEAVTEVSDRKKDAGSSSGTRELYENVLKVGRQKKECIICTRHMTDAELGVFEQHLLVLMRKTSPDTIQTNLEQIEEWEYELERLQGLKPAELSRDQLNEEIPGLEDDVRNLEKTRPELVEEAEKTSDMLVDLQRELKEIQTLKQHATTISRLRHEVTRAQQDAARLEDSLSSTGSTKTAEDLQIELSDITSELRKNERETKSITNESERQTRLVRDLEKDLHELELKERDISIQIRDKERMESDIEKMKQDIIANSSQCKELDAKIAEAQAPIDALQLNFKQVQRDLTARITEAQRLYEELNKNIDRLKDMNKSIERYVKEKKPNMLVDCSTQLEDCDKEIRDLKAQIEVSRECISNLDKNINESGATHSNLRDNIIVQKLNRDIAQIQAQIDSYDMEEAATARRNFEDKYEPAKERERKLHETYNQISGELGSLAAQLKTTKEDLKGYKDVYKKYTDQLIRVKVSDMANNDLEKYAKALDNAIMKYHGLKMEEVNDTMKHLWNKTYQGTDIDGIKIISDADTAGKRSYNYRVVMTKDQVEMDMRGRCSAGQKMLASIIIRLALSDSFGQNCGILALDEPTNALDTENIDALAESLVDIINERKNHSNFQLIIITHDEAFLRKLGQSDVMEYYWYGRLLFLFGDDQLKVSQACISRFKTEIRN